MKRKYTLKERLIGALYVGLPVIAIALAIWWEYGLWNECRETNSFWYCMRVLGK